MFFLPLKCSSVLYSRSVFRAGVSLNIQSFIPSFTTSTFNNIQKRQSSTCYYIWNILIYLDSVCIHFIILRFLLVTRTLILCCKWTGPWLTDELVMRLLEKFSPLWARSLARGWETRHRSRSHLLWRKEKTSRSLFKNNANKVFNNFSHKILPLFVKDLHTYFT